MTLTQKLTACMCAAILAATMFAPAANACSLPYVDDVNDWGKGKVIVTLYTCITKGETAFRYTVKDTKTNKAAKVTMRKCHDCGKKHIATVVMKRGHVYKITVKAKDGKRWNKRAIAYCVY